jgi:hypothetical protein
VVYVKHEIARMRECENARMREPQWSDAWKQNERSPQMKGYPLDCDYILDKLSSEILKPRRIWPRYIFLNRLSKARKTSALSTLNDFTNIHCLLRVLYPILMTSSRWQSHPWAVSSAECAGVNTRSGLKADSIFCHEQFDGSFMAWDWWPQFNGIE